jgi:CBS domain-containing protein
MKRNGISGIPVVERGPGGHKGGKLVGILTNRDVRFADIPPSRLRADDEGAADHRPRRRRAGRGAAAAAPAPHREAAGRR